MKIYTVGQVNNYINNIISQDYMLKRLSIRGEVSNCKYHSMGHIYFSIKDESGSLAAVMFKSNVSKGLGFTLKDGQSVVVSGRIGVFERDGKYQMYAESITLDGIGRLYQEFERLKYKLNDEGLFDPDLKKPIPKFPKRVGIVTAKTGAAIQDIINVARRRNPYVQLLLYPAKVQGEGAAQTIVKGIKTLDGMGVDTIIIGRGGGSIEDLWAFNEEIVVRAIYEAKTPIVSGTGHEVDITLSDYAADLRAPTPSAACELTIPDVMRHINNLNSYRMSFNQSMSRKLSMIRLTAENFGIRLFSLNPEKRLRDNQQYLADMSDRINKAVSDRIKEYNNTLLLYTAKINALSPTAKLINGFGYIERADTPVTGAGMLKKGDELCITFKDGKAMAQVTDLHID